MTAAQTHIGPVTLWDNHEFAGGTLLLEYSSGNKTTYKYYRVYTTYNGNSVDSTWTVRADWGPYPADGPDPYATGQIQYLGGGGSKIIGTFSRRPEADAAAADQEFAKVKKGYWVARRAPRSVTALSDFGPDVDDVPEDDWRMAAVNRVFTACADPDLAELVLLSTELQDALTEVLSEHANTLGQYEAARILLDGRIAQLLNQEAT